MINITSTANAAFNLQTTLGTLARQYFLMPLMSASVGVDPNNVTKHSLTFDQGSLGMPSPDVYLNPDKYADLWELYNMTMQTTLMALSGETILTVAHG